MSPSEVLRPRAPLLLAVLGVVTCSTAVVLHPRAAQSAAAQTWPPFVLISGLLLVGLVCEVDGLFAAAGQLIAHRARNGLVLYICAVGLVVGVTALLNLDTSVAFLTPVLIYAARRRGEGEAPLLYGCLLLSNAGSLFLPGSNLTNLIVLGNLSMRGGEFFRNTALAGLGAVLVTAAIVGWRYRNQLRATVRPSASVDRPTFGVGLVAVGLSTVFVLLLRNPALPVALVGVTAVAVRVRPISRGLAKGRDAVGVPVLVGLFGIAVALGTVGRVWVGPTTLMAHLDAWETACVGAVASVLFNNLPAASILAARTPPHPLALLVGLNIGPNVFVTGSLSWVLWWRAAKSVDARPSLTTATRLGLLSAPLAMAVALVGLRLGGVH